MDKTLIGDEWNRWSDSSRFQWLAHIITFIRLLAELLKYSGDGPKNQVNEEWMQEEDGYWMWQREPIKKSEDDFLVRDMVMGKNFRANLNKSSIFVWNLNYRIRLKTFNILSSSEYYSRISSETIRVLLLLWCLNADSRYCKRRFEFTCSVYFEWTVIIYSSKCLS